MTLPNKLTVGRLVMAPLFFIMFNLRYWVGPQVTMFSSIACLILFVAIELTDLLDGKIARRYHLVTDLGKVMDPFGDTLSHLTYFVCFMMSGIMPSWVFVVIMYREFAILFVRLLMVSQGHVGQKQDGHLRGGWRVRHPLPVFGEYDGCESALTLLCLHAGGFRALRNRQRGFFPELYPSHYP